MTCIPIRAAVIALATLAAPLHAQGFEEGSFGDTGGGGSFPAPGGGGAATPPSAGGFDEGSFPSPGGGSGTPSPPSGGGDFDGGSFDPGQGGGTVQPQPQPQPNPQPQPPQPPQGPQIDPQIAAIETRDFGVPPQSNLRNGQFHAPTPTSLPGGQVVTTQALAQAMQGGMPLVLIEVLGGSYGLPNSYTAPALASPGSLNDGVQQQANQWLWQITGGDQSIAVVVYCSDPMCWLSYNAALRVQAAGYRNVFWYRGGIQAWQMAGLPMHPLGF